MFGINQVHQELVITARSEVDVHPAPPPNLELSPAWEEVPEEARRRTPEAFEAGQFVFESPLIQTGKDFAAWAAHSFLPGTAVSGRRSTICPSAFMRTFATTGAPRP